MKDGSFRGFLTANTTGAKGLKRILSTTEADVVCAQELKVVGDTTTSLRNWASAKGWKCIINEAKMSKDTGGLSSGVGIFVREHIGLGHPPDGPAASKDGRAIAGLVEVPGLPAMICVAAYMRTGEGLSEGNLELLRMIGEWCGAHRMPFIVGADWNMQPSMLESTTIVDCLHAAIVADPNPIGTCTHEGGATCIDYFLMSADIAEAAESVRIVPNAPIATHRPVLLKLRADAASITRIVSVAVQRIPPVPVYGPWPPPQDWRQATALAQRALRAAQKESRPASIKYAMGRAYREWAPTAEEELAQVAGITLRDKRWHRGNRFKTEEVPLLGSTVPTACPTGTARRWIARRARDISKAIAAQDAALVEAYLKQGVSEAPQWFQSSPDSEQLRSSYASMICLARRARHVTHAEDEPPDEADIVDAECFQDFVTEAEQAAERDERQDAKDERASWSEWVIHALSGGGGAAHRFVKGDVAWQPTSTCTTGKYSVAPGNLLLAEHRRCADLWVTDAEKDYIEEAFLPPALRTPLPKLTVQQLREAGAATPAAKAVTFDGIHPRHATMLADEALEALSILWQAVETAALLPHQLDIAMAPLIPKKGPGYRDIVLFPGVVRLCSKARVPVCRAWEMANERRYFAAGVARSAPDVVWRTALKSEVAGATKEEAGAVLWDMTSFFQMLRHRRLLHRAQEAGYPMPLARLAVYLYRCERRLCLGKSLSHVGVSPNRGIAPGCSFATSLVKAYCMQPFDEVVAMHPSVDFDVYIDDLQIAAQGSQDQVAERIVAAAVDLKRAVQDEIMAELAQHKAATVATSTRLAKRIRRALGDDGGIEVSDTTALGIDFSCGRRRGGTKMGKVRMRLKTVAGRRRRIALICKASKGRGQPHKLVKAGVLPTALYGASVTGLSDTQLLGLRRTCAAGTAPRAQGRSLDVALQLSGLDPTAAATGAPMLRWAQEVWNTTGGLDTRALHIKLLRTAWEKVQKEAPKRWRQVRGPIGAAIMSGRRLGWDMEHAFEWRTDAGVTVRLAQDSPALVKWHIEQSARRSIERRVASSCGDPLLAGRRADLSFTLRLLRSKSTKAMCSEDKCTLRCAQANALWPRQRQYDAGYDVDPTCQMCGAAPDTVHHRCWCCEWEGATRMRQSIASPELIAKALRSPDAALYTRGLRPHPVELNSVEAELQQMVFRRNGVKIEDRAQWTMSGSVFYDGSCLRAKEPELATAAFAVVEIDEQGQATATFEATVQPGWPQTSQAAEQGGRLAAVRLLSKGSVLYGDCKTVVDAAKLPRQVAGSHKRMYAGARRAAEATCKIGWACDVKVKAHRKLEDAADERERWEILGNAEADSHAVHAQTMHRKIPADRLRQMACEDEELEQVCRVLGALPRLWPATEKTPAAAKGAQGRKKPRHRPTAAVPHEWANRQGELWCCERCYLRVHSRRAADALGHQECPGLPVKLAAVVADPNGHVLVAVRDSQSRCILACTVCGCWAHVIPRRLLKKCEGKAPAKSEGYKALRRLALGEHPQHDKGLLDGPVLAVGAPQQAFAGWVSGLVLAPTAVRDTGACGSSSSVQEMIVGTTPAVGVEEQAPTVNRLEALRLRVLAKQGAAQG